MVPASARPGTTTAGHYGPLEPSKSPDPVETGGAHCVSPMPRLATLRPLRAVEGTEGSHATATARTACRPRDGWPVAAPVRCCARRGGVRSGQLAGRDGCSSMISAGDTRKAVAIDSAGVGSRSPRSMLSSAVSVMGDKAAAALAMRARLSGTLTEGRDSAPDGLRICGHALILCARMHPRQAGIPGRAGCRHAPTISRASSGSNNLSTDRCVAGSGAGSMLHPAR